MLLCPLQKKTSPNSTSASVAASPAVELMTMSVPVPMREALAEGSATCQKKPPAAEGDEDDVVEYAEASNMTVTVDDACDDHP